MSDTCDESFEALEKIVDEMNKENQRLKKASITPPYGFDSWEAYHKHILALLEFARDCRDNYDCDTGANGVHPSSCRACNARKLLSQTNTAAITLAKTI